MKTPLKIRCRWHLVSTLVMTATVALAANGRPAAAAAIKVACVGDQMVHSDLFPGNRESQPPGMQEFPRKLQDLMGAGYDVRNFGDCCASVIGGYVHSETHPYVSGSNYSGAVAFLPDIVLIAPWGRHDWGKSAMTALAAFSVPAFQTGYEDILTKFEALSSKPKIIVSNLVPLPNGMDGPDNGYKTSPQRDVVLALAAKHNLQVVDTFTAFTGATTLFIQPPMKDSDGEHTSDAGSTMLAQMFAAAIKGMGGPTPDAGAPPPVDAGTNSTGGRGGGGRGGATAGGTGGTVGGGSGGAVVSTGSGGDTGTGGAVVVSSTGGAVLVSTGGAGTGGAGTGGAVQTVPPGTGGAAASGASAADSGSSGCACRLGAGSGERAPWGLVAGAALLGLAVIRSRARRRK